MIAAAGTVRIAVANSDTEKHVMTTETQITFQKTPHSITVLCSVEPATISKLVHGISRLLQKLDVSAKVTVVSNVQGSSEAGAGLTVAPSGVGGIVNFG